MRAQMEITTDDQLIQLHLIVYILTKKYVDFFCLCYVVKMHIEMFNYWILIMKIHVFFCILTFI